MFIVSYPYCTSLSFNVISPKLDLHKWCWPFFSEHKPRRSRSLPVRQLPLSDSGSGRGLTGHQRPSLWSAAGPCPHCWALKGPLTWLQSIWKGSPSVLHRAGHSKADPTYQLPENSYVKCEWSHDLHPAPVLVSVDWHDKVPQVGWFKQ